MPSSQRKAARRVPAAGDTPPTATAAEPVGTRPASFAIAGWVRALVLVCAALAAFWNGLDNPLVLDDRISIEENDTIRDWTDVSRVLSPRRESPVAGRPLVNATFALNYAIAGIEPTAYRATNLAIHVLCALLLMGVVRRTLEVSTALAVGKDRAGDLAWAVALVWAVHPLNSEVVDYLTQRTESMMALFLFGTLYASARAHRSAVSWGWQVVAVVSCALGMACKESMVVAPLLVFVCDGWLVYPSVGAAVRARAPFYAALATTWGALAALNWHGPRIRSAGFGTAVGPWTYLLNQLPIIVDYLRLSLWPRGLVAIYGEPLMLTVGDVWLAGLAVLGLGIAALVALRRRSWLGVAGAWFFIALAPASSIVPIVTEVGAERRMYVPLVAVVCVVVWAAERALSQLGSTRRSSLLALGGATLALAAGTFARNAEYAHPRVLAQTVLDRRPSSYGSHMMAEALVAEGRSDEAMPFLRQAIQGSPRAQFALGVIHFNKEQYREAFTELDAFVRREPLLLEVVTARVIMGKVLALEGRWSEAAEQFRQVLRMNPAEAETPALLAQALFSAGDYEAAITAYNAYLARSPNDLEARSNLGIAFLAVNRTEEGVAVLLRNIELNPDHVASRVNVALALFDLRRPDEALPHAQRATLLEPDNPDRHDFLGRVYAVMGRFGDAQQAFQRALQLDPGYAPARDNLARLGQFVRSLGPAR